MSLVKNIEDDNWTKNYTYYDKKGRAIGSYSINHLGGRTKVDSKLDFAGMVKQSITRHKRLDGNTDKVITENFTYDHQNRLLAHTHQVDSNPIEYLAQNTYNEISQLTNKKVGGITPSSPLQSVDYTYNIRGWMTKINDPANLNAKLFGYEMRYTNPVYSTVAPGRFNGNIAEVDWKTSNNGVLKRYNYQYDNVNRLLSGVYSEPSSTVPQNNYFNETLSYDLNGNISSLQRNRFLSNTGVQLMDDLTYTYAGNTLNTITDGTSNFGGYPEASGNLIHYDLNGSMTDHVDKGVLQISYNFLSLPNYVKFDQTYIPRHPDFPGDINVNAKYLYRADGTKLRKIYTFGSGKTHTEVNSITEYLDGFQYAVEDVGGMYMMPPKFVPTPEGYFNFENNKYIYHYTDHLGNIRLSYTDNGLGAEAIEENNYYPFGLKHGTGGIANPDYKYQYNGKEYQSETGWYDYGARFYMPDLGRWGVVDPLAEMMRRHSPYNYVFNNPINFVDPDGRAPAGGPGDGTDGKTYNIQEVVITVRRNTNSFFSRLWNGIQSAFTNQYSHKTNADKYGGLNSYRQWQGSPFYNQGETKMDRMFRLMGNSKNEEMLNFGGGAYNMNGGYGRVTNVSRAVKATPELIFTETSPTTTWVHANNTQVGLINYAGSAVKMEINLSQDMQGMGIGSKIFGAAVEDASVFEANWVKSSSLYPETGMSNNLIQYNNAIQKGASATEAAWSTWSGNQAKINGFNSVNVQPMQNGIKATFTK
jgi:RHS repeat-associated protein